MQSNVIRTIIRERFVRGVGAFLIRFRRRLRIDVQGVICVRLVTDLRRLLQFRSTRVDRIV